MTATQEELEHRIRELQKEVDRLHAQLKEKRFGLTWIDVPEAFEAESENSIPVLEEVPELAVTNDDGKPTHILIEGDNYHALTCLNYTHRGKVDVIYIDPPYNTGKDDFTYRDKRFLQEYPDGTAIPKNHPLRHSAWLSFMERRLRLAKELLSDKGVIFISIDENEQAQLKLLCDEIFGTTSFRNILFVRRRTKTLNLQFASNGLNTQNVGAEYVLVYANSEFLFKEMRVKKKDTPEKGTWNVFWSNADRPTMRYELLGFTPTSGQWRWAKELADEAVENYKEYLHSAGHLTLEEYWNQTGRTKRFIRRIRNGTGKNGGVQYWVGPSDTYLRTTNWTDIEVSQIHKDFDLPFDNPKNVELIKEILSAPFHQTSTILDFFAGSGTTMHATMQLNAEDGGRRQCILCQLNEADICRSVTYERNRRVMQGYTDSRGNAVAGLGNSMKYYRTAFVGRHTPQAATDDDKLTLAKRAGCLLSLAENTLYEVATTDHYQLFTDRADRRTCIYFQEDYSRFEEFRREVSALDGREKAVYVFCWGDGAEFATEFEHDSTVTVKPIPQPILDIYKSLNQ